MIAEAFEKTRTPRSGERRILVTGATGFVGRHVVKRLLEEGFRLTLAVRSASSSGYDGAESTDIRIVETGSLEEGRRLEEALSEAFAVVHLAGLAHIPETDARANFDSANARATALLAKAAGTAGVDLFVHMSSLAAITSNARSDVVDDTTAPEPVSAYGRSKLNAEQHVARLQDKGICAVSLRPPLIIGDDAGGNWASLQKLAASGLPLPFGSIRNKRSVISVRSVAEAIVHLCRQSPPTTKSGDYCIADQPPLSLPDIVRELRASLGLKPRLLPCHPAVLEFLGSVFNRRQQVASLVGDLVVDSSRFCDTFAIRPTTSLREEIRRSGEGYRDRRH